MNDYDIMVVGAGPAGAMAAMSAASAGKRVCLLERKAEAGVPVRCGEGIGHKGLTLTQTLRPSWLKATLTRARMVSPNGTEVNIGNVDKSYILDRARMDADLVKDAVSKGAAYFNNTPVISAEKLSTGRYRCVTANKNFPVFTAACLILADGVESRLARHFGWDTTLKLRDIETCAFARVKSKFIVEDDCCTFYTGGVAPGGYLWIFPRGNGEANVGLGVNGSKCEAGLPQKLLLDFISQKWEDAQVSDVHCGGVPVGRWVRPLVKGGVALVGDAARQVNAMSGAGIAYSLYAGRECGTAAARAIREDGSLDSKEFAKYHNIWAKNFGKQVDRSFALKEFVLSASDGFLDDIAKSLSKEDPQKINYRRVFMRTFAKRPLLLWKAFWLFK